MIIIWSEKREEFPLSFTWRMDRNRVARVIRTKNRSNCHAYVALSLYPITGSENVFRYWGSSWGRVPDADFLRPATNYHEPSPIITITNHIHTSTTAYTHIHAHTRNTQKNNSLIPDLFTSTVSLTSSSFYMISYFNPLSRLSTLSGSIVWTPGERSKFIRPIVHWNESRCTGGMSRKRYAFPNLFPV